MPLPALPDWLANDVASASGPVAVLAGHFAIFSAGASAHDLLDGDAVPPSGAVEMLAFTRLTWQLGCELVVRANGDAKLVVLVDDLQFVRPALADRSTEERLAAALAAAYLERTPTLPGFHLDLLASARLNPGAVHQHRAERWMLSERELRLAAVRRVRDQLTGGNSAGHGVTVSNNGDQVMVAMADQREFCLVHSGHTGCAGGYAELLATLYATGIRHLVALVPARCLAQVTLGTEIGRQLFDLPGLSVSTLGIADPAVATHATIARQGA
jgi:hypothetical protein